MEEQGAEAINQPQCVLGNQDSDQLEGCCYGWRIGFESGARQREGLFDWYYLVDDYCCASDVYEFYGRSQFIHGDCMRGTNNPFHS